VVDFRLCAREPDYTIHDTAGKARASGQERLQSGPPGLDSVENTPLKSIRENGMSRVCDYSGKRPQVGKRVVRRGKAKREGGIGQNVTGISKRRWKPNLQKIRVVDENGRVRTVRVCARYIKAGKFTKYVKTRPQNAGK